MSNMLKKVILAAFIFFLSVAGPAYSFYKKGYTPGADYLNLVEARNFAFSGTYKTESALGIFLSSDKSIKDGVTTGIQNPLTPIIYGQIFSWFGFHPDLPFWISIFIFGFFNVLLFFLATKLFGGTVGFFAGIIAALMPSMVVGALHGGYYEWALLFFGFALWTFLGSSKEPFSPSYTRLILASIFFSLAALSRNAFAISFLPFLLFNFWHNRSIGRSTALFLPFVIIFGLTLTPLSWIGVPNGYTSNVDQPFQQIGHFFTDPYTYHFQEEEYREKIFSNPDTLDRVALSYAIHFGYPVSLSQRLSIFADAFKFYLSDLTAFTSTGGIVIIFLMVLGGLWLWKNQKTFALFFGTWIFVWLGYLVYSRTSNWNHSMEIVFLISSLAGIGMSRLADMLACEGLARKLVLGLVLVVMIGNLATANKWRLFDTYRSSRISKGAEVIEIIKRATIKPDSVIAVGTRQEVAYMVNYELNYSTVYFHTDTINGLSEQKLKEAMVKYGVTYAAGFNEDEGGKISRSGINVLR